LGDDLSRTCRSRSGFTILELLVSMGIIALLVAILLPAVQQSRAAARRAHCQNNLRNVAFALLNVAESNGRFPAAGNFGRLGTHHSWVVDVLPWLELSNLADRWDKDKTVGSTTNEPLSRTYIPVITCPDDITVVRYGDLSFVVNGGVGFTIQNEEGTHDCPVDPSGRRLDLNANGVACPPDETSDGSPSDKDQFLKLGLFFNETWKWDVTQRNHRIATVLDGMSNTMMLTENVRTGFDPDRPAASWASPNPYLTSFYIGNPCRNGDCSEGAVDYSLANSGTYAINSGLARPEGTSAVPNSFHAGGVNVAFCDGRIRFVSEQLDGRVYAAWASPQGGRLHGTPLEQQPIFGLD